MSLFGPPNVEKLKSKRDEQGLIKALNYAKTPDVQKKAAEALGEIGGTRAVEPLIATLKNTDENLRQVAASALGKIGAPAVTPLIAALERVAAEAARQISIQGSSPGPAGATPEWMRELDRMRVPMRKILIGIGSPAVLPLIAALKNTRSLVQMEAAMALGEIGNSQAVEPLKELRAKFDDRLDLVRLAADGALKKLHAEG